MTFQAIYLSGDGDGSTPASVRKLVDAELPASGGVTVRNDYSTVNYKDGLAITRRVIDGAGVIIELSHLGRQAGDG